MDSEFGKPLREFAKDKSQPELAELLGVTQSAVSQMLNSSRDIRVRCDEAGECMAVEIRPIGRRHKPKQ
ncbi:helix-turn-helix domain-containing protein [Pseudomonas putida]|uniref:Cro/CI family transcriptional regulator n=1 Tax=Pseudomonas putida TaxID=303 RepID=UPI001179E518|nr:helix-turn-helix domain-containing protein [Pseudomonas putida]